MEPCKSVECLTKEDHERFNSLGFEVVKRTNGTYYVRPSDYTESLSAWARSIAQATIEGFIVDELGNILNYTKPRE